MPEDNSGLGRREFIISGAATLAVACAGAPARPEGSGGGAPTPGAGMELTLLVNGEKRALRIDPRTTLLDLLRENLGLTGAKKGCDMGQCGACTVLIEGKRVNSCLQLAVQNEGRSITTIEGLASKNGQLHAMQEAFIAHDAFQCGYCT